MFCCEKRARMLAARIASLLAGSPVPFMLSPSGLALASASLLEPESPSSSSAVLLSLLPEPPVSCEPLAPPPVLSLSSWLSLLKGAGSLSDRVSVEPESRVDLSGAC